ncbi:hypothetical protein [Pseudoxanthomonas winnipegensis]|uniref:hypothetical protein n=1 Tax=Pseudoxanthomonas winnipegensis TaxID=2480810 RepID=UPI00197DB05D|nr:hypothetical protein [Pseudoxanthomonas winnipegensis]
MAEPVAELDNVREEELEERAPSKAAAVHERISRQGEKELARDFFALFWSAIAAGMTMSMSFLGRALLQAYLPDAPAAFLIEAAAMRWASCSSSAPGSSCSPRTPSPRSCR